MSRAAVLASLIESAGIVVLGDGLPAGAAAIEVTSVTADSRRVGPGAVFVAVDGLRARGADFAPAAVAAGAVAIVAEVSIEGLGVPVLRVADARGALGHLASAFHGHPSHYMQVIAVTGTNGKSTTTLLCAQLLSAAGIRAAAIGTLGVWTPAGFRPGQLTTPEATELQALLAGLRAEGFAVVALEASSHALDQQRLDGTRFAAAAWTNVSRDHLDYHGTEANYARAKARLFRELLGEGTPAYVNGDDPHCLEMVKEGRAQPWFLNDGETRGGGEGWRVTGLRVGSDGLRFHLSGGASSEPLAIESPLLGRFNGHNLVAALLLALAVGADRDDLQRGARDLRPPPGRLEPIENALGALVLVDFAHTPDALAQVLDACRSLVGAGGQLLVAFGCGGDRDGGKRQDMGRVAAERADLVVLTSDNPRSEDPGAIVDAIEAGARAAGARPLGRLTPATIAGLGGAPGYLREVDRGQAIRRGIGVLRAGDVFVIAGKGHERSQLVGTESLPFDDAAVAAQWLGSHRLARTQPDPGVASGLRQVALARDATPEASAFAFDGRTAAQICDGTLICDGVQTARLSTDTRALRAGDLFVALVGERFDANEFVGGAVEAGATGIICSSGRGAAWRERAVTSGTWVVEVADTLVALGDLARAHRQRHTPLLIGITGSNGKTTTRAMAALAIASAGPVLATHGNYNNRIGVPLTLARLGADHRFAVVEMGTSEPGEIAELCRIAQPRVGVLTGVAEAHLEKLGDLDGVAVEKAALIRALPEDGVAVVPDDVAALGPHLSGLRCRVLRCGRLADSEVRLVGDVRADGESVAFVADVLGRRTEVRVPGIGLHLARGALLALGVAVAAGVDVDEAARGLARFAPVGQRMRPSHIGALLVLEDCYNANPSSVEMALETLASLPAPRVAVLGDMLELGAGAGALHARVGRRAAELKLDALWTIGRHAPDTAGGAIAAGMAPLQVNVAGGVDTLVDNLRARIAGGGTLLVKGSRGARMERVIDGLRADHIPAETEDGCVPVAI